MGKPAATSYRMFHGKNPSKVRAVSMAIPSKGEGLTRLGKAMAIEYECSKLNGGGDGKRAVYRHEFETPCDLSMYQDGKNVTLFITGTRLKVTDRGIEN
jgi:hypothetical protein